MGNRRFSFRRYKSFPHQLRQQTSRLHLRNNPYPEFNSYPPDKTGIARIIWKAGEKKYELTGN